MSKIDRFIRYGVESRIAEKATSNGLTTSKARVLSQKDMIEKFDLSSAEAKHISNCIKRAPIDKEVVDLLLESANYTCCVCHGVKGTSYIIHHIEEYEKSQNNTYSNLAVLCPNDHDLAHRPGGLSNDLSPSQIQKAKMKWEKQVEIHDAQKAARAIEIDDSAVDYINVMRIEAMCAKHLGSIPFTTISEKLIAYGILDRTRKFDQNFVRNNLSNGRYLFDYINHEETEHYRQLLSKISEVVDFVDLSEMAAKGFNGVKDLEGKHAFFIGGVYSKSPDLPITSSSPPIAMHYPTKKINIFWDLDPNYLMSMSSISRMGRKNRYIVYCSIRSVERGGKGEPCQVVASPLLISQPSKFVHKTPAIAYIRRHRDEFNDDEDFDIDE
nr:HNH endonuclease signature motif containing protein [Paracoccus saliphilus]